MFTGHEPHAIKLADAAAMTKAYRDAEAPKGDPEYTRGCYFSKDELTRILNQPEAVGIRFYLAKNSEGKLDLVAAAVKADESDILENVLNHSKICPPVCCKDNALNA